MICITFLEVGEYIPQRGCAQADQVSGEKVFIQVGIRKSKKCEVEVCPPVLSWANRVRFCQ